MLLEIPRKRKESMVYGLLTPLQIVGGGRGVISSCSATSTICGVRGAHGLVLVISITISDLQPADEGGWCRFVGP